MRGRKNIKFIRSLSVVFAGMIFICIFSTLSMSQSFKGGLLLGLTTTQVDGDRMDGYNKPGAQLGGYVKTKIKGNFGMSFELKLIQKGSRNRSSVENPYFYKISLNYIETPLLLNYTYKEKLIGEAGVGLGYLALQKEEDVNGSIYPQGSPHPFSKFEFSATVAIKYKISKHFFADIRFSYSIIRIRKRYEGMDESYWTLGDNGQFNNLLGLAIYYQFGKD